MNRESADTPEQHNIDSMRATLTMLQEHIERGYKDFDTLDNKARSNIAAASLILTFAASLQVLNPLSSGPRLILVGVVLFFYVLMLVISLVSTRPRTYVWPVKAEWSNITSYWQFGEHQYITQLVSDYIKAIEENREILDEKSLLVLVSNILFGVVVVLLAIAGFGAMLTTTGIGNGS